MSNGGTEFGYVLRSLRQQAGVSLRELSRRSDIPRGTISRLETGSREAPGLELIQRLAAGLRVPEEHLLVAAGYQEDGILPTFQPYLRTKYGHLSEQSLQKLEQIFLDIAQNEIR
jgi:transcriptional regulator with XRE-family HTH domain